MILRSVYFRSPPTHIGVPRSTINLAIPWISLLHPNSNSSPLTHAATQTHPNPSACENVRASSDSSPGIIIITLFSISTHAHTVAHTLATPYIAY